MKTDLSDRELAVLSFAAQGFTDEMVAHELGIQCGTVNSYWTRIRGKLGNYSRSELVARFVQKNADFEHSTYVMSNAVEAASLADENRVILESAQTLHTDYILSNEVEAASLATENRDILAKANAEIENLKQLLADATDRDH